MANSNVAFIQLFWDLLNRKTGELGHVDYTPQKPAFDLYTPIDQSFPRSTPEEQGVSSRILSDFVHELQTTEHVEMHQLMILRHDHVIYEGAFDPYRQGVWHVTYSMCKSFTGMAVGLLIDEGRLSLDTKALDILEPQHTVAGVGKLLTKFKYSDLTVRDLLIMSSGASFNETGAISGNDWVKGYFDSLPKFAPGTKFEYNSMNSFILSAIVTKITGVTMFEYLRQKLFIPMGISKVFWETSPIGVTKAGWGMFITQEDAAKLGSLYMHGGAWKGNQLISKSWVEESTRCQIKTGREDNPEYGYHIWMGDVPGSFMYNGMLGQNVYCYPDRDMIIVVNAGNDEVFSGGTMTGIIRKYFGLNYHPSADALPEDPIGLRQLIRAKAEAEGNVRHVSPIVRGGWGRQSVRSMDRDRFFRRLSGRVYEMHSKGIGLFPLIMQVVHNNYTNGISMMRFDYHDGRLSLIFREGEDVHTINVGFGRGRHSLIRSKGEEYLTGCIGRLGRNEDHIPVLTLRIAFIEEATERRLKIYFKSEKELELHWDEVPGNVIIADTLEMITTGSGNVNPIFTGLMSQVSPGLIKDSMRSAIQPMVRASLVEETSAEMDLREEDPLEIHESGTDAPLS